MRLHAVIGDVMPESPTGIEFVEELLGWMHERPQMYCRLVGELDLVLHYLHLAWAKVKDRERDLDAAMMKFCASATGFLSDAERVRKVQLDDDATRRVLDFWTDIDSALGLRRNSASTVVGSEGEKGT